MSSRVSTPFGAQSTAAEVIAGIDLSGRRAIVTGGASGIGVETARALAVAHAEVTLAVRNLAQGRAAAGDIIASTGHRQVQVGSLDLADPASVAAFAAGWRGPLDILVNNAGLMAAPLMRTPQGWEMQFATNHLGHFALANGLHEALAAAGRARVVVVSSVGHLNGEVLFDDINFERHPYDPWAAYSQSKTANILFTVEAARRWAQDGITVNALTPGRIATNLTRYLDKVESAPSAFQASNPSVAWKTAEQGAAISVLLAASPLVDGVTGRYFEDGQQAEAARPGVRRGVAAYALDPGKAARLWRISADMLAGLTM
jgi:NAD(P)-dependent dehydrogenase (short-subunit alcohol dehydrogenase family)